MKNFILLCIILTALFSACSGLIDTYENTEYYNLYDRGPAGGWICYINPSYETDGWRYLEAASEDISSSAQWSNIVDAAAGTGIAIGTGRSNANAIMAQPGHSSSAAQLCNDYSVTVDGITYDDWHLPSIDELKKMYFTLNAVNEVDFSGINYWSSSEESSTWADYYTENYLGQGVVESKPKSSDCYVRAIRMF